MLTVSIQIYQCDNEFLTEISLADRGDDLDERGDGS
jgi:hypothetical protein